MGGVMKTLASLFALGFSSSIVACAGGGDEVMPTFGTEVSSARLTVIEPCSGVLSCDVGGQTTTSPLTEAADGCHLGSLALLPDGTVHDDDFDAVWTATATDLTICVKDGCIVCKGTGAKASAAAPAAAGKCTGTPSPCSSRMAGSCAQQDGCRLSQHSHVKWNGDIELESECDGWPTRCEAFATQSACEDQLGCAWK